MAARDSWSWVAAGVFTLLGFVLLWLGNEQWLDVTEIAASTFEIPAMRVLLWLLTQVAAGLSFGLAVGATQAEEPRARIPVLAVWSLIPFGVIFYFWAQFAMAWLPAPSGWFVQFLYSEGVLTGSALVLGVFIAGMVGRIVSLTEEPTVAEPEDVSSDE